MKARTKAITALASLGVLVVLIVSGRPSREPAAAIMPEARAPAPGELEPAHAEVAPLPRHARDGEREDGSEPIPRVQPRETETEERRQTTEPARSRRPGRPPGDPFDPATGGLAITGRVLDADGQPVESAHVQLSVWNRGSLGMGASDGGRFGFRGRPPGTYTLNASTKAGGIALERVVLVDESVEVDLTLAQGGRLRLALDGVRDSARCRIVSDGLMLTDFTLRKGKPAEQVAPPGPALVQLWVSGEGIVHERTVQVVAGETREVALNVAN